MRKPHNWIWILALIVLACTPKGEERLLLNPPGTRFLTNFHTMQLVGDFNGWNLNDLEGTRMELVDDWTWSKVEYFSGQRTIWFKFVPDQNWDLAYGTPDDDGGRLSGTALPNQSGVGNHIDADIPGPGYWRFTLNELTGHYEITQEEMPPGGVAGTVTFEDDTAPPYPEATLVLYSETDSSQVASTTSDTLTGAYRLEGIPQGTYFLAATAPGYVADTAYGLEVGTTVITGVDFHLIPLAAAAATPDPPFLTVTVDGDLSDWPGPTVPDSLGDSHWGPDGDLGDLYVAHDAQNLYIGLEYSLGQNACIIYIHAETPDPLDGDTSMADLDWFPRNFHFLPVDAPEFLIARWDGDPSGRPELRHIPAPGTTELVDPGSYQLADVPAGGNLRRMEVAIPFQTLYGLGEGQVPPYLRIRLVTVIAGGDGYGGPETVPDNPISNEAGPILIENLYEEIIDTDGH